MSELECKTCMGGSGDYQCAGCVRQELDIEIRRLTKEKADLVLADDYKGRKIKELADEIEALKAERDRLREAILNESSGALPYVRHYYGSQAHPRSVNNLLSRLEKLRIEALNHEEVKSK